MSAGNARRAEAVRQQAIVAALFAPDRAAAIAAVAGAGVHDSAEGLALGLSAYRGNGLAIAERALQAAYPVTFELLGKSAAAAAAHLWRSQPPRCGDLAEWGGGFADWLAAQPSLADFPELPGCAAIEWARHRAASAADATMDVGSLALLGEHAPETLRLRLKPGVRVVRGAPGFHATWAAQAGQARAGDATADGSTPPVADCDMGANDQVPNGAASEAVAVWRDGFAPRVLPLDAAWAAWLEALICGASLQALLATLPAPDLETTLATLITRGWLLDIVATRATNSDTCNDKDTA